jgi:hypothetical protein
MTAKPEWQRIHSERDGWSTLDRFPVPGGWIYRIIEERKPSGFALSTCFVPNPQK